MDGFDLRDFQEGGEKHEDVKSLFGRFISGREGYETVLEKKSDKPQIRRCECGWALQGGEKFCPECGNKCCEE